MSCWPRFRFFSGPIVVTPTRPNPTSMDVMPWIHWNWNAWWILWHEKKVIILMSHHFCMFLSFGEKKCEHPSIHFIQMLPIFVWKNRDTIQKAQGTKIIYFGWQAKSLHQIGLAFDRGKREGRSTHRRIYVPSHSKLTSNTLLPTWFGKIWKGWPEEIESPRDVENSWASS